MLKTHRCAGMAVWGIAVQSQLRQHPAALLCRCQAMHAVVAMASIAAASVRAAGDGQHSPYPAHFQAVCTCAGWLVGQGAAALLPGLCHPCIYKSTAPVRYNTPQPAALPPPCAVQGDTIGEVRQRWHLWRRKYDLFMGKRQFAAIDGGLLAWEFELKDGSGNTLALIDRCVRRRAAASVSRVDARCDPLRMLHGAAAQFTLWMAGAWCCSNGWLLATGQHQSSSEALFDNNP